MVLVSCPECGRKISNIATACPYCGYSITASNPCNSASIKIGDIIGSETAAISRGTAKAFTKVILLDKNTHKKLGWGEIGSVIKIELEKPKHVILRMAGFGGRTMFDGTIEPGKRYELVSVYSVLLKKWSLNEVNATDSSW